MRLAVTESLEALESRLLAELDQATASRRALLAPRERAASLPSTPVPRAVAPTPLSPRAIGPPTAPRQLLVTLEAQRDVLVRERAALAWLLQKQQRMSAEMKEALETVLRSVQAAAATSKPSGAERQSKDVEAELRSAKARLLALQRDRRESVARNEALETEVLQLRATVSELREAQRKTQKEAAASRDSIAKLQRRAQAAESSVSAARAAAEADRRRLREAEDAVVASERRRAEQANVVSLAVQQTAHHTALQAASTAPDGASQALAQHVADKEVLVAEVRSLRAALAVARTEAKEVHLAARDGHLAVQSAHHDAAMECLRKEMAIAEAAMAGAEHRAQTAISHMDSVSTDLAEFAAAYLGHQQQVRPSSYMGRRHLLAAPRRATSRDNGAKGRGCHPRVGARLGCDEPTRVSGGATTHVTAVSTISSRTPQTRRLSSGRVQEGMGIALRESARASIGSLGELLDQQRDELARAHARSESAEARFSRASARVEQLCVELNEAREAADRAATAEAESTRERLRVEAALRQLKSQVEGPRHDGELTAAVVAGSVGGKTNSAPHDHSSLVSAQLNLKVVTRELAETEAQLLTMWAMGAPDASRGGPGKRLARAKPKTLRTPRAQIPSAAPSPRRPADVAAHVTTAVAAAHAAAKSTEAVMDDGVCSAPPNDMGTPSTLGHSPMHESLSDYGKLRPKTALQRRLEEKERAEADRRSMQVESENREQAARRQAAREYAERVRKLSLARSAGKAHAEQELSSGPHEEAVIDMPLPPGVQGDGAMGSAPALEQTQEAHLITMGSASSQAPTSAATQRAPVKKATPARGKSLAVTIEALEVAEAAGKRAEADASRLRVQLEETKRQLSQSRQANDALRKSMEVTRPRHGNEAGKEEGPTATARRGFATGAAMRPDGARQRIIADTTQSELEDLRSKREELMQSLAEANGRIQTLKEALEQECSKGAAALNAAVMRANAAEADLARVQREQTGEEEVEAARKLRELQAQEVLQRQLKDSQRAADEAEEVSRALRIAATAANAKAIAVGTVFSIELLAIEGEMSRIYAANAAAAAEVEAYAAGIVEIEAQLHESEARTVEAQRQGDAALLELREQLQAARDAHAAAMASQRDVGRKEWQGKLERLQGELRAEMASLAELPPPSQAHYGLLELKHYTPPRLGRPPADSSYVGTPRSAHEGSAANKSPRVHPPSGSFDQLVEQLRLQLRHEAQLPSSCS